MPVDSRDILNYWPRLCDTLVLNISYGTVSAALLSKNNTPQRLTLNSTSRTVYQIMAVNVSTHHVLLDNSYHANSAQQASFHYLGVHARSIPCMHRPMRSRSPRPYAEWDPD